MDIKFETSVVGIKAGYQLSINTYEGDGDNPGTKILDGLRITQVYFYVNLLRDLEKTTEGWTDEKLYDLVQKHESKFPGVSIFNYTKEDVHAQICNKLLWYPKYYDPGEIRQVDSLEVIWVEHDCYQIPIEEFYK